MMVNFVGAGPGAPDLITLRGREYIQQADVIIYAGLLVNPALLGWAKPGCVVHNSAGMTLDEVLAVMEEAAAQGKTVVRLHTGDPSLYGAIREQMDALREKNIPLDQTPGVSAFSAKNDMAGNRQDSWKNLFEQAGMEVSVSLKGLGEYPEIRALYAAHAKAVAK